MFRLIVRREGRNPFAPRFCYCFCMRWDLERKLRRRAAEMASRSLTGQCTAGWLLLLVDRERVRRVGCDGEPLNCEDLVKHRHSGSALPFLPRYQKRTDVCPMKCLPKPESP